MQRLGSLPTLVYRQRLERLDTHRYLDGAVGPLALRDGADQARDAVGARYEQGTELSHLTGTRLAELSRLRAHQSRLRLRRKGRVNVSPGVHAGGFRSVWSPEPAMGPGDHVLSSQMRTSPVATAPIAARAPAPSRPPSPPSSSAALWSVGYPGGTFTGGWYSGGTFTGGMVTGGRFPGGVVTGGSSGGTFTGGRPMGGNPGGSQSPGMGKETGGVVGVSGVSGVSTGGSWGGVRMGGREMGGNPGGKGSPSSGSSSSGAGKGADCQSVGKFRISPVHNVRKLPSEAHGFFCGLASRSSFQRCPVPTSFSLIFQA